MLHLLYIIAFTILAFVAVGNLIRNLITLGFESHRTYPPNAWSGRRNNVPHPEFLDASGNVIREPLMVMRSMTIEDAREQLDALYDSSPGNNSETSDKES